MSPQSMWDTLCDKCCPGAKDNQHLRKCLGVLNYALHGKLFSDIRRDEPDLRPEASVYECNISSYEMANIPLFMNTSADTSTDSNDDSRDFLLADEAWDANLYSGKASTYAKSISQLTCHLERSWLHMMYTFMPTTNRVFDATTGQWKPQLVYHHLLVDMDDIVHYILQFEKDKSGKSNNKTKKLSAAADTAHTPQTNDETPKQPADTLPVLLEGIHFRAGNNTQEPRKTWKWWRTVQEIVEIVYKLPFLSQEIKRHIINQHFSKQCMFDDGDFYYATYDSFEKVTKTTEDKLRDIGNVYSVNVYLGHNKEIDFLLGWKLQVRTK